MERRDNKNIILVAIFTIVFVLSTEFVLYLLLSGSGDSINFFSGNSGKSIAGGISKIYDATVVIEKYENNELVGNGSGFIYSKNGYIMTNYHVVSGNGTIRVILANGNTVTARLLGGDDYSDIAVLKIDSSYVTQVATLGSSENANVGDEVFTIGAPIDATYAGTVTKGILSGKNRMVAVSVSSNSKDWIMNVMQTDAAINPGNSGGPLCNLNGEVIGINSMKIIKNEVEGIGFAIPIEDAREYANNIINGITMKPVYLGISMSDLSNASAYYGTYIDPSVTAGVLVVKVVAGGPCANAGMVSGDVITKVGDTPVNNVAELRYYLYKYKAGEQVKVTYKRLKQEKVATLTIVQK